MRRILIGGTIAAIIAAAALTTWIASLTPKAHSGLMQQLARSGLARDRDVSFEPGWLTALSQGEIELADSLCRGCDRLAYKGEVHHGIGAWLKGHLTLLSLNYALDLPDLPVEPALPSLLVTASQSFGELQAELSMPASQHQLRSGGHRYQFEQGGVNGRLLATELTLFSPKLGLARDQNSWLQLEQFALDAAAREKVQVQAQAERLKVPLWQWVAEEARLDYKQRPLGDNLNFHLQLSSPRGRVAQQDRGASQAEMQVERLNLPATRAFIRELPGLLDDSTPPAARMFGMLSLYSIHGPAFFASQPAVDIKIDNLPLPEGNAQIDVHLAVLPGLRRPPMHPKEWQQAISGHIDILAPASRLKQWWGTMSSAVNLITGLPRQYEELQRQGWVKAGEDDLHHLYFKLDPQDGLQGESTDGESPEAG